MSAPHFEWDPKKAAANRRKHGVTFEEARIVFEDEEALIIPDPEHSDDAYSGQSGQLFRFNSARHSGSIRPLIPDLFGHLQRVYWSGCNAERRIG
jgi:hypothetical protein